MLRCLGLQEKDYELDRTGVARKITGHVANMAATLMLVREKGRWVSHAITVV